MSKVQISESILQNICNEISIRENSIDPIKPIDFASRIANLPKPGDAISPGQHCDLNGKWHKPDDWDDIESIDLTGKHECYFLCDTQLTGEPYLGISLVAGDEVYWSYGHVVDGEFIQHESSVRTKVNLNTSKVGTINFSMRGLTDRYIVVKVEATDFIGKCMPGSFTDKTISSTSLPSTHNCAVMRYGRITGDATHTLALACKTYFIESDRIVDFGLGARGTTNPTLIEDAYTNDYVLQRVRLDNFDLSQNKVSSCNAMFSACYLLSDLPDPFDLSGLVTANCTSLANMFNACFSIKSRLILKNWDITNVTTMANMFNKCIALPFIDGIDTWTKAASCTTFKQMFNWCHSLRTYLDLSNLYIGNAGTNLVGDGIYYMFTQTKSLSGINLNNANLTNITTVASLFNECSAKELVWDTNFTPPGSTLTLTSSMFASATGFKEINFNGWDFSKVTNIGNMFNYTYGTEKLTFTNCIPPNVINDTSTAGIPFTYMLSCKYLDVSFLDLSKCAGTALHTSMLSADARIVDFYPPQHICKNANINGAAMLSHDSIIRILNNLDETSSSLKLVIGASNLNRLTDDEKAIATNKGWTLA